MIIQKELKLKIPRPANHLVIDKDGKGTDSISLGELTEEQFEDFLKSIEASYRSNWSKLRSGIYIYKR